MTNPENCEPCAWPGPQQPLLPLDQVQREQVSSCDYGCNALTYKRWQPHQPIQTLPRCHVLCPLTVRPVPDCQLSNTFRKRGARPPTKQPLRLADIRPRGQHVGGMAGLVLGDRPLPSQLLVRRPNISTKTFALSDEESDLSKAASMSLRGPDLINTRSPGLKRCSTG